MNHFGKIHHDEIAILYELKMIIVAKQINDNDDYFYAALRSMFYFEEFSSKTKLENIVRIIVNEDI